MTTRMNDLPRSARSKIRTVEREVKRSEVELKERLQQLLPGSGLGEFRVECHHTLSDGVDTIHSDVSSTEGKLETFIIRDSDATADKLWARSKNLEKLMDSMADTIVTLEEQSIHDRDNQALQRRANRHWDLSVKLINQARYLEEMKTNDNYDVREDSEAENS